MPTACKKWAHVLGWKVPEAAAWDIAPESMTPMETLHTLGTPGSAVP